MPTPRKRSVLTLSVARNRRAAVEGALHRLRQQNAYTNISSLVLALIYDADKRQRIVPTVSPSDLPLLEAMRGEISEDVPLRDVIAVSVPLAQSDAFFEALTRVQERSRQKNVSSLITSLLLDTALQAHHIAEQQQRERFGGGEPPDYSAVPINKDTALELSVMWYTGNIADAYALARALYQQLMNRDAMTGYDPAIVADLLQRIALAFRDAGYLDLAFEAVSQAIDDASEVADGMARASLLVIGLYRRAGIFLQKRQQEQSDANKKIFLNNARADLEEAYRQGSAARRGLREEAGLRLAKVLVLLKTPPEKVSHYFDQAFALFAPDSTERGDSQQREDTLYYEDESGIVISKAGMLHRRAQLSVLYAENNLTIADSNFSLAQAREDVETALELMPRMNRRWRVDMQLTLVEIALLEGNLQQAERDLDRLQPFVRHLHAARIEERYDSLRARLVPA